MKGFCKFFDDASISICTVDEEYYLADNVWFCNSGILFLQKLTGDDLTGYITHDEVFIDYCEVQNISLVLHHPKALKGCENCEKNEESCER